MALIVVPRRCLLGVGDCISLEGMRKHYQGDDPDATHMAAQLVEVPLSDFMVRLMAQELPILDSHSRSRVYEILREHKEQGLPTITAQEDLPQEIKEIMDL